MNLHVWDLTTIPDQCVSFAAQDWSEATWSRAIIVVGRCAVKRVEKTLANMFENAHCSRAQIQS